LKVTAKRSSGYVFGRCEKCGMEERGVVMFERGEMGVECLECGDVRMVEEFEWVD
jgi:uncharacterized Zn finger protein